jgi:hypothetical protein
MSENINADVLADFEQLTSYDIVPFLQEYVSFTEEHYSNIVNYYEGSSLVVPADSFNKLKWLTGEQKQIVEIFQANASSLDTYDYWILLEYIEDIGSVLATAGNASKWLRSVPTSNGYKQVISLTHIAKQGQTIESIERTVLASSAPEDSWVETALENDLAEEDYTPEGGYLLKVNFKNNSALFIQSVVDNIDSAEKTYGLDVKRKLEIVNNDLVTLDYWDTIMQTVENYSKMLRGDNPSLPDDGIDKKSIVGKTLAAVSYPIVFRQLASLFAKDDSFKEFQIQDVKREKDAVYIYFQVKTRAGDAIPQVIAV